MVWWWWIGQLIESDKKFHFKINIYLLGDKGANLIMRTSMQSWISGPRTHKVNTRSRKAYEHVGKKGDCETELHGHINIENIV